MKLKTYTVFAIYRDNMQRHATTVQARNPTDAQHVYAKEMSKHQMLIAGVAEGKVQCVDTEQDNAEWPSINPDITQAG